MTVLAFILCTITPIDISDGNFRPAESNAFKITQSYSRIIPHITRPTGGFQTSILIESRTCVNSQITLNGFDEEGVIVDRADITVQAFGILSYSPDRLFEEWERVSHITISEWGSNVDKPGVSVSVVYTKDGVDGVPAQTQEFYTRGKQWNLLPGNWDKAFDGLAMVNTSTSAIDIEIEQVTFSGFTVDTHTVATGLLPYQKVLYLLNGEDFESTEDTYFRVRATGDIALLNLRGDNEGLLWSNPATIVEATLPTISAFSFPEDVTVGEFAVVDIDFNGDVASLYIRRMGDRPGGFITNYDNGNLWLSFNDEGEYQLRFLVIGPDGTRETRVSTVRVTGASSSATPVKKEPKFSRDPVTGTQIFWQ